MADLVLYDGTCALCHGVVRFLIARDRAGTAFVFSPLAEASTAETVRVQTEGGVLLTRSDAVLYLLERVGGVWRVLALAGRVVPRKLRDAAYTVVARSRYRVFGRTATACPVVPEHLRARFR
ncbi:MAG TPA: DCC1-like thiol-disulfide oxidoreductase family protein [Candidatus Polarisedimenticolaceae bacterium]|nr:DCC1-like thiol-disulfide oxidoreductase family protein [Candidatus Polarisedimenticolaceae bacterium]